MKYIQRFLLLLALALMALAILNLCLVGGRVILAFFDVWKFGLNTHGIDLGANSSFAFLAFSLLAIGTCISIAIFTKNIGNLVIYRLSIISAAIHLLNGFLISFLVFSGLAFLYCGR